MSLSSVEVLLKAKLISALSVTATFDAPLRRRHSLTAGQTHAALVTISTGTDSTNSNLTREVGAFIITVVHRLSDATDEAAYIAVNMIADQGLLSDPAFYNVISGVFEVVADSLEIGEPERQENSNVIEYTVTVQLTIT